ncbi:MAG: SpoIIE family protein phosphatase [Anaerolineales bacterium]|nr:SpoIIE family protein phosphatase [Anaerolineales bacterium]
MTDPSGEIERLRNRVQQLEQELDDMTVALAQAWDQLAPLLQDTSQQQATTVTDLTPVLETVMAAIGVDYGAIYLKEMDECFIIPNDPLVGETLKQQLQTIPYTTEPIIIDQIRILQRYSSHWVFMPMLADGTLQGVIGVGVNSNQHRFNSYDMRVLARMTERATSQITAANLAQSRHREARLSHELQIAHQIQLSIQPLHFPTLTQITLAANWQPAQTVGGDAWGWIQQTNGNLTCFLLDVSGKGLPAALAAVSLHTALVMALTLDLNPVETLTIVNDQFYDAYTNAGIFATAVVIAIDPYTGMVEQANAGHPPTLACMDGAWYRWEATAPPIGVLPDLGVECQTYRLLPGDTFVCYSDGFSEIETPDGLWGDAGIVSVLSQALTHPPSMIQAVLQAAESLQQGRSPHDDQTIVIVHYAG